MKHLEVVGKYLETLMITTLVVFAPIKSAIIVVAILTFADLVLGVIAARKRGEPITSSGLKRSIGKILIYQSALCLAFLVEKYLTGEIFPASKLISALIGLVELKSVLENLDSINGQPVFRSMVNQLITKIEEKKE